MTLAKDLGRQGHRQPTADGGADFTDGWFRPRSVSRSLRRTLACRCWLSVFFRVPVQRAPMFIAWDSLGFKNVLTFTYY